MEISSVALPPVEAKPAALFVALELSKSTWLVALHSPAADKVSQHRLAGGDAEGLLTLIGRRRAHAEAVLGRPVRVVSCYEAGYDGFWLHCLLDAAGGAGQTGAVRGLGPAVVPAAFDAEGAVAAALVCAGGRGVGGGVVGPAVVPPLLRFWAR